MALDFWLFTVYCETNKFERGHYNTDNASFGFKTPIEKYKTVPLFLLFLYIIVIFVYLPVIVKILIMFKKAYKETYEEIKYQFMGNSSMN